MLLCARTTSGATASWFSWWWPSAKATDGRDSTTCLGFGWPTCSGGMASVLIAMSNSKQCVHGEELVGLHEIRREVATVGQRRAPTAAGALNRPGDESPRVFDEARRKSTRPASRPPTRRAVSRRGCGRALGRRIAGLVPAPEIPQAPFTGRFGHPERDRPRSFGGAVPGVPLRGDDDRRLPIHRNIVGLAPPFQATAVLRPTGARSPVSAW